MSRKVLETQPYRGITWQRLYILFDCPDRVFRLLEVKPNRVRLYEDERGSQYVQRDLHERWKVMEPGEGIPTGVFPPQAVFTLLEGGLCRVSYVEKGCPQVRWVDMETGYRHEQCPYVFERAFLRLLREGNWVFVRNIREEAGGPYRNWQVRCDREFCTVGDSFYFADRLNGAPYRIKKRSEDFRMFVLEAECLAKDYYQATDDFMVINLPDQPLELTAVPVR